MKHVLSTVFFLWMVIISLKIQRCPHVFGHQGCILIKHLALWKIQKMNFDRGLRLEAKVITMGYRANPPDPVREMRQSQDGVLEIHHGPGSQFRAKKNTTADPVDLPDPSHGLLSGTHPSHAPESR